MVFSQKWSPRPSLNHWFNCYSRAWPEKRFILRKLWEQLNFRKSEDELSILRKVRPAPRLAKMEQTFLQRQSKYRRARIVIFVKWNIIFQKIRRQENISEIFCVRENFCNEIIVFAFCAKRFENKGQFNGIPVKIREIWNLEPNPDF